MRCGIHQQSHHRHVERGGEHQAGMCHVFTTLRWCPHAVAEDMLCAHHLTVRNRRIREEAERQENRAIVQEARARIPRPTWQAFMDEVLTFPDMSLRRRHDIAERYLTYAYILQLDTFEEKRQQRMWFVLRWTWAVTGRMGDEPQLPPPPPPAPAQELQRLAHDAQNVHTTVVSNQTNAGMEKLLTAIVPADQSTERKIAMTWMTAPYVHSFKEYLSVANDMNLWFTRPTCRNDRDWLYRKLLRGIVATIDRQPDEIRKEVYKRLWEECKESVGLCCEGHISRLCNVFVGFDETFKPPVSIGEILQNKMSAIAAMLDVPADMKIVHANAVFDELGVPHADRVAWLEAF